MMYCYKVRENRDIKRLAGISSFATECCTTLKALCGFHLTVFAHFLTIPPKSLVSP
jgi:hypothetical protein